jgi:hypothetical protein
MRMPVQYFERAWLGCGTPSAARLRGRAQQLCADKFDKTLWLREPMGRFALTNEFTPLVQDIFRTVWWRSWVLGTKFRDRSGPAIKRVPDAVVLSSWLWHVKLRKGNLLEYESQLRSMLQLLVVQLSYREWWSKGRLWWRAALPTELDNEYSTTLCERANVVARRVLSELAPEILWLSQTDLLQHVHTKDRAKGTLLLTSDGKHYFPAVQIVLMEHLLATVTKNRIGM